MAYAHNITTTDHGLFSRAVEMTKSLSERFARYKIYRQTVSELSELSARDLADLGIHRSSIRAMALQAAYGN